MAARIRDLPSVRPALLAWHRRRGLPAPWRESRDPYRCLVAAVMAQQTQMSRVMPAYARFVERFPTVESLAAAPAADVIRAWRGMGYNRRAVRLHRAAQRIAHHGWPVDAVALVELDGVGQCTAAIVASFAYGEPAACVDTNVRRVLGRLAGDETLQTASMRELATTAISRRAPGRWNQALMDYGALVCTPRPRCGDCVVARWCRSRRRYAAGGAAPPQIRRQTGYPGSTRYYRGRIIDVLRELPAGGSVRIAALQRLIADGRRPLAAREVGVLVGALVSADLAVVRRGRLSLPE